jgi:soluble lytic murein transglycosylase-like protein
VSSAKKYDVDPKLVASIMIVESRANPFAISTKDAIGIMQIHLPTWGPVAHREGINLFRIEENVDFGTRILKDYVAHFGVWQGVRRYKGWNAEDPASERSVDEYLAKVQRVYGIEPAEPAETDLLE